MTKKLLRKLVGLGAGVLGGSIAFSEPAARPAEASQPPVMLETYKVDSSYAPKLSFGIGLEMWKDNNTQRILSLYVQSVRPGSEAETKGLTPRARLLRIDGQDVTEFEASFRKGTRLNEVFVNRANGAKVTLEFTVPGSPGEKIITLEEHRVTGIAIPSRFDP